MGQLARVAWFRLRAGMHRRWTDYVSVVLLVGILGGVALAAVAGARRTEASFPTYLASTNPSTVGLFSTYLDPALGFKTGYDPRLAEQISHLPLVTRSASGIIFDANIDIPSIRGAHVVLAAGAAPPTFIGSPNGEFASMDRLTVTSGRAVDPGRADEAVMNAQAAKEMGLHVGSVIQIPIYTDAQLLSPNTPSSHRTIVVRIVGVVVASDNVVQSDIGALNSASIYFSPALTRELSLRYSTGTETQLQIAAGSHSAKRVFSEIYKLDPSASHLPAQLTTSFVPTIQRAIEPEALALGVFGGIALFSALLIAGLLIGRIMRRASDDLDALRAIGADRPMLLADALVGMLGAVSLASLLAVVVAVLLSPLAPIGPVRSVYPDRGVAIDGTVLGLGFLSLLIVLVLIAVVIAWAEVHKLSDPVGSRPMEREPRLSRLVGRVRLPVSAEAGIRFAVEPGRGRSAAPVRSAMLGAVLAITVLVAAITFGSSLNSLVSHPPLYGWNWNYAMLSGFAGAEDLPGPQIAKLLDQDHLVQAWSGVNFVDANLDGQRLGFLTETPGAKVAPPLLSGHGLQGAGEAVLGPATLAALHKRVGDTVTVTTGITKPTRLVIVGTATMPAITHGSDIGTGALVSTTIFPAPLLNLQSSPFLGPNAILVRIRPGVAPSAAIRSLKAIDAAVNTLTQSSGLAGGISTVLRPVEIVNFRSMGTTPALLAAGLAAGAFIALGLTLGASVRRRRRDLALLKALGFTRLQLAASISWQATVASGVGVVVGVPLGVIVGRQLWLLFARNIDVVPVAAVPAATITLLAIGAVLFANLTAALPGRAAARTPTALVLRAE